MFIVLLIVHEQTFKDAETFFTQRVTRINHICNEGGKKTEAQFKGSSRKFSQLEVKTSSRRTGGQIATMIRKEKVSQNNMLW